MSDGKKVTAEEFESFRAEVLALYDQLKPVLLLNQQGTAVAVCLQIVYEQLQDPGLPTETLEFMHQNIIVIHDLIHKRQLLKQGEEIMADIERLDGPQAPPKPPSHLH